MMHVIVIEGEKDRHLVKHYADKVPYKCTVTFEAAKRSLSQNKKLWTLLSAISLAKPDGLVYSPEVWKCLFMSALGYEQQFVEGLNGEPFPIGFKTSRLSKKQMSELIEFIEAWAVQKEIEI